MKYTFVDIMWGDWDDKSLLEVPKGVLRCANNGVYKVYGRQSPVTWLIFDAIVHVIVCPWTSKLASKRA